MFKHKKVIVIIPAYNTEKEIYHVFKNLKQVSRYFSEIIVLDDNSSDNTLKSLRDIRKKWKNEKKIFILKHKKNLGYGATQKHLFEVFLRRKGDIAVLIHADNQYPPNNIKNLVKPILNGKADIVLASRFYGNMRYYSEMPVYKILGNKVLTLIENIAINTHLSEFHTGLRSYSKKAIEKLNFEQFSNLFVFDSEILFRAHDLGLEIVEIPTFAKYDKSNVSHLNSIKYGLNILFLVFMHFVKKITNFKKMRNGWNEINH